MKRSEVNRIITENIGFIREHGFCLPPFAFWTPQQWAEKDASYDEIRDNCLGWDLTDFGSGDYEKVGLFLFTIRNGNQTRREQYPKPYAEKVMVVNEGQVTPYHYHWYKMEDIINRGGGTLVIRLYNADEHDDFADTDVTVHSDGRIYTIPAGGTVRLGEGESITLLPKQYHSFWAEDGKTMVVEVSQCNDDSADNCFHDKQPRFPAIEEDEPVKYYLCNEYPGACE